MPTIPRLMTDQQRGVIVNLHISDQQTKGRPLLPPSEVPTARQWLMEAMTDPDKLEEHYALLSELYRCLFRRPTNRRDRWEGEPPEAPRVESFTHYELLPEERARAVEERGPGILTEEEVANLLLNPFALHDLVDLISTRLPDWWIEPLAEAGRALRRRYHLVIETPDLKKRRRKKRKRLAAMRDREAGPNGQVRAGPPNLFDFATSELSQDAFICWLASWADPALKEQDQALHATATGFLDRLLEVGKGAKPAEYWSIEVRTQWKGIDVLLVVNGDTAIIIEDKTDTKDHSGQLARYKKAVADEFPKDRIAAVYLKTGDQSNYRSVEEAGYGCFRRREFLAVLDRGAEAGVRNDIFADFHRRLRQIDAAVQSYRTVPLAEWDQDPNRWVGFFMALQQRLGEGEWDYRGHAGGQSLAFRWHRKDNKFLRLMQEELCFRLEVPDEAQRVEKWRAWKAALVALNGAAGIPLTFPACRPGERMAVATFAGDYRQADEQGLLDMEKTVALLKKAEALMDAAVGAERPASGRGPV
jgi:hypothetical protein